MILALFLAVAEPAQVTAIDAERAFVNAAQKDGQWTAFRKYAAPDALMFVPQPIDAHVFLKDRKDPLQSVYWWPGRSYVACDGTFAVNTGPWVRGAGKSVGYFTTVWRREGDQWRWTYDAGDELKSPRAEGGDIKPVVASCSGKGKGLPASPPAAGKTGGGMSADQSLVWRWSVAPNGARTFETWIWNGKDYDRVIDDQVSAEAA